MNRYSSVIVLFAAVFFFVGISARCAADPLIKVDLTTVTATQYGPDDKEIGKASELTDGNEKSRAITRNVTDKDLPLRIVFDMGAGRTVGKVRIANYFTGQNFDRGWKIVDIFVGDTLAPATGGTPASADVQLKISDANGPVWTEIPLANPVKGRYVTVRVKSNWGGANYAANEVEIYTPDTKAGYLTIVSSFPADQGPSHKPNPDTAGAAGPKHVVDFDDGNFVVHDKTTGKVLLKKTQEVFWASVEPANTLILSPNDPRILYDPLSQRWFAVIADRLIGNGYLAVSTSTDPTKAWKGIKLPMPPADLGFSLGIDKNGLYMCYVNRTGNVNTMHDCLAIPKADAIAPGGPDVTHSTTFHNLQMDSFPATDLDPNKAATAPEVLLNKEFGNSASKLYMYKITWAGATASISTEQIIRLGKTYSTPNGGSLKNQATQPAPGGKLRADEGRRTIGVFAHGDSVFGCNEAKSTLDTRPGLLWYEVRISDGALLQEGFVDDADHDYLFPSLAVDANGNIGLGCTRTSATEFPSIYVMMHAAGDPAGTMRAPMLAMVGTTYYHVATIGPAGIPWGNYSSTCIDPTDPLLIWTCQEYANSDNDGQWCTGWVSFKLTAPAATPVAGGGKTFTGTASASGTHKRPLLIVDGTTYELKASDKADATVAPLLAKFSGGDTSTYTIRGTKAMLNGRDGILVDSITAKDTAVEPAGDVQPLHAAGKQRAGGI